MVPKYRIHPGIGIARLGNSPDAFCISPEQPGVLPVECDAKGNAKLGPDGQELRITQFKDSEGRVKRQAARFQVWVYDDETPQGRPLKLGDHVEGGGNAGTLKDIQWRVYLANKKSSWYQFRQLEGENGYAPGHPRRNPDVTGAARQRLIIDPGPRTVDHRKTRIASFDRDGGDTYATIFPPPLQPHSIDTLGTLITDDTGHLLVLGGYGNSGSYLFDEFGQPRIDEYANNDGWFDDTSDGPVMARLMMFSELVQAYRFIDVEYPAWCIVGYPAYVPEILDIVTMDDVIEDMGVREFAMRPELYGTSGTFDDPQYIDPTNQGALTHWRAGRLRWNPAYKPWFYRDVWTILYRPDQYSYLCSILGQSNFPHNQSTRGTFDPTKLSVPPETDWNKVRECERRCLAKHRQGELFTETLSPALLAMEPPEQRALRAKAGGVAEGPLTHDLSTEIQQALVSFIESGAVPAPSSQEAFDEYLVRWRNAANESPAYTKAKEDLEKKVEAIINRAAAKSKSSVADLRKITLDTLRAYHTGRLLEECRLRCIAANTKDPFRADRQFIFDLLRQHGEENNFFVGDKPSSRVFNLPLMPLLAGDNPISNTLPSKFLRLTDYQFYILRQWALGHFFSEVREGWGPPPDPWLPYKYWVNRTARDLDRGVLTNLLGGAFCPGGEAGWILRTPAVYREPYRLKADPAFYSFAQTAAQANTSAGSIGEGDYASYTGTDLSQDNDYAIGLQPGDVTKSMACPWQADFNECSTQVINITYEEWNQIYPDSDNNTVMQREQRVWETLWWPAHRPLQTYEQQPDGSLSWLDWTPGVPQTNAGDLKMVTEWWRLSFVKRNPKGDIKPTTVPPPPNPPYISVERTRRKAKKGS